MQTRSLGNQLTVSAIGYGCMGLSHAYGVALDRKDGIRRIQEAFEHGYTFFDTAEVYTGRYADGSLAVNEDIVGEALRPVRDQVIIATKGGISWGENFQTVQDSSPKSLRRSLEGSLRRLGVETIDLYYQHRPDPAREPEEVAQTMSTFIREGKIRSWAISNATADYVRRANAECKVAAVQMRYSMMARWHEPMFPMLEECSISLVAYSPLANGFLSAVQTATIDQYDKALDYRSRMPQYTAENMEKSRELITAIRTLAQEKNATPAQLSLAWMLCKKPWIIPIPGTSKSERIAENAAAADVILSKDEIARIDTLLDGLNLEVFGEAEKAWCK